VSRRGTRTGRRQHVNVPSYSASEGRGVLDFRGPPHNAEHVRLHLLPKLHGGSRIAAFRAVGQSLPFSIFKVHVDLPFVHWSHSAARGSIRTAAFCNSKVLHGLGA